MILDPLGILLLQGLHNSMNVLDQHVAPSSAEVLAHDHTHQLELLAVRSHGVGWHDPGAFSELMSDRELVEMVLIFWVQAESDERQSFAASLGHDLEAQCLNGGGNSRVFWEQA